MHEFRVVSVNLRKRATREAASFATLAIRQLGGDPVVLLQEVGSWTTECMPGFQVFTSDGSDVGVAVPSRLAPEVRDFEVKARYCYVILGNIMFVSIHLPCHSDRNYGVDQLEGDLEDLRKELSEKSTRFGARHLVIGSDLNVSLPALMEGVTGRAIHPVPNGASHRWRQAIVEWAISLKLRALNTFEVQG